MEFDSGSFRHHGRRRFKRGMLKYVLLKMLLHGERHGYDLMRLFGERGWGSLAAGTLYPTLAKLEEMGYVEGRDEGGRRTYRITEAGKQRLRDIADELESEFTMEPPQHDPGPQLREAMNRLANAVSQAAASMKPQTADQIAQRLDAVRKEIYLLLANE